MLENKSGLYAAFMAKDARFDGRFFVGVSSTGIYCRPVCRAKQPKSENCTFYHTAAEAEQAGYRPCLLCRPELAPGSSIADATANLVYRAARMLEENCGSGHSLDELSGRLGCTDRHLRRVFKAEYNVSPVQYLQTCRLLLAKNLLTDTDLPILEVAMAAGFGSLRRFNDLFKKHYNLSPTALRKRTLEEKKHNSDLTLALGYRLPYPWEEMQHFLAGRAIPGIEIVKDNTYMRTVHLVTADGKHVYGWVRVGHRPQKNALTVTVSETLMPVLPQVLARVRHLFDLYCDPDAVYETLRVMNDIRPGLCVLGTRLPGCFNAFEMAVRAVLGQQITVKAASTLAARIVDTYGMPIQTGIEGLTHVFPSPEDILALDGPIENHFGPLGVIAARSRTIYELARAIVQGEIDFDFPAQPEEEIKKLMTIRGIGSWTAQYIAMRAMEWPDAFLETDVGVKKALQPFTSKELLEMSEAWRPWRSYATINLWNTL
ncbi:helix-turn-helix domain-containing protein [Anaerocolumna sedimenticola]|uniref:DNA-3-methyladenine glycosylase II n=1 Tax=Anaerocolumna sedimenticola TaxID=2696063 RepID=A0A6P1TNM5_9FIRM|nr:DNA-3-methyladenine glycosylase 2 family protein [Anaerocolumna sedimenticola]QHQ61491.1 helix-turn-helix domain-containing protein [Anaerocolumna sedimenticola]